MNLTTKQKQILGIIVFGNPDDKSPVDLDQLIERLPYVPSKDSMHFSIRALVKKGLIEKGALEVRRGRSRRLLKPTALGEHWAALVCPKPAPLSLTEVMDLDELDEASASLGLMV